MNNIVPYFFLSYSRFDRDVFLERFWEDLRGEVAKKMEDDREPDDIGFFSDLEGVKTGEDWYNQILHAVATTRVMVCIYSVRYFSKSRVHEFCAREFTAFLMRRGLSYQWYVDGAGPARLGVVPEKNLLPILWHGADEMQSLHDLPPTPVRTIKYDLQVGTLGKSLNDHYRANGLLHMLRRRRDGRYWDIIKHLAAEIIERAKQPPPPLDPRPVLDQIPSAFWDPPPQSAQVPEGALQAALPPNEETALRLTGPRLLIVLEVRRGVATDDAEWIPYAGAPSAPDLIIDATHPRQLALQYVQMTIDSPDFNAAAAAVLAAGTEQHATPIVLVDPATLNDASGRAKIQNLLREPWVGGAIIPAAAADAEATWLANAFRQTLQLPSGRAERLVLRGSTPTAAEFLTAVVAVADEVLARIAQFGVVHRLPAANDGPSSRPRISNARSA